MYCVLSAVVAGTPVQAYNKLIPHIGKPIRDCKRSPAYRGNGSEVRKGMPFDDRELLARLIQCEAGGEGEHGMAAVASVIMNRTHIPVGEFARVSNGGNVRNIIEQEGQFNCMMRVLNGDYNAQNIYNMDPTDVHYAIADWALAGIPAPWSAIPSSSTTLTAIPVRRISPPMSGPFVCGSGIIASTARPNFILKHRGDQHMNQSGASFSTAYSNQFLHFSTSTGKPHRVKHTPSIFQRASTRPVRQSAPGK